jgi:hypothetical protein
MDTEVHMAISRIRIRGRVTAVLGGTLASLALLAPAAHACTNGTLSQPFKQFGDSNYYTLAPGATFESGVAAWDLNANGKLPNATATGNETFFLNASTDTTALQVKAGGQVVSPPFCVDGTMPHLRFVARKPTATSGQLKVELLYADPAGNFRPVPAGTLTSGSVNAYAAWKPTPNLELYTALPMAVSQGTTVKLRLTADKGGDWLADDVFVDPRLRG